VISGEYLNYAADGRECWIHWVIKTIADENGQVVEMQAVGRDVTEIKQAEEKIRQLNEELEQRVIERTRELEEANEEIRNFAYIVSHDLRAPLVNLKGFASELRLNLGDVMDGFEGLLPSVEPARQDRMRRALQEDIPEALRFIESSVSNMDTFTKAILKLSRLGRLHLELVEVDVKEMVEKTLDSLAYQIDQQGIEVNVGDLPVITADFVSMEQVFGNILTNAVMYCDPDRPGKIEISAEQRSADTVFRIQDNGRGIAKEDMDKVFTPFRRAGEQDMPGEGMGLAYVQALVRRHGGRIWCESEPGVGTTFTFTIAKNLKEDNIMP
jgi:signal transduction histidine kinase